MADRWRRRRRRAPGSGSRRDDRLAPRFGVLGLLFAADALRVVFDETAPVWAGLVPPALEDVLDEEPGAVPAGAHRALPIAAGRPYLGR